MARPTLPERIQGILARNIRIFSHNTRLGIDLQAEVDQTSRALVTVSSVHQHGHAGELYQLSKVTIDAALGTFLDLHITTPARASVHMRPHFLSDGPALGYVYEAPTVSVAGTPTTPVNRNRRTFAGPAATVTQWNPTFSALGTELEVIPFLAPLKGPATAVVQETGTFVEWVLKEGTEYLVRIENTDDQDSNLWLNCLFYESPLQL